MRRRRRNASSRASSRSQRTILARVLPPRAGCLCRDPARGAPREVAWADPKHRLRRRSYSAAPDPRRGGLRPGATGRGGPARARPRRPGRRAAALARARRIADDLLPALADERRRAVLAAAPPEEGRQWAAQPDAIRDDCVGRLMEPPQRRLPAGAHGGARRSERIRELVKTTFVTYGFVTDDAGVLLGVVAMRDLLFAGRADARSRRSCCATRSRCGPSCRCSTPMRLVVARHFPVYPVCDDAGRLVGIVRGRTLFEQQAFEISAQAGSHGRRREGGAARDAVAAQPALPPPVAAAQPAHGLRGRRRWSASSRTRSTSSSCSRSFLPVLAGQSGNTGCQALAVTLRGLTLGELRAGRRAAAGAQGGAARPAERRPRRA